MFYGSVLCDYSCLPVIIRFLLSMTITNSSTRLAALVGGVAVALALMGAVAIAPAQAAGLTSTQIQSIVSLLASFGADSATIANVTAALNGQATSGSNNPNTGTCPALSRSIWMGSSGADVMALQVFLNANAATRVSVSGAGSPGMETTYFGPATKAAVIKFQAANNVSPIGVVGPATRAAIAAVCGNMGGNTGGNTGGTTSTGPLSGGEADLRNFDLISGEDLMEGDSNKEIAIAKFDVKGGDVQVQRVTVDFQPSSSADNEHPWTYIDTLSVYDGSKKVGSVDASSKDAWDQSDDDTDHSGSLDFYTIDIPVNDIVREDDRAELSIRATAQDNIDESDSDTQTFKVQVPTDGIRAVDSKGIQQYTGDGSEVTLAFDAAESGDLTVKLNSGNPTAGTVVVDDNSTSDSFDVLKFDIKNSDSADVDFNSITFSVATTAASGSPARDIRDIVRKATLSLDGKTYDGTVNSNNTVDFDNLDASVDGDSTITGTVSVELFAQSGHYASSGESLTFSLTGNTSNVDAEGASTGDTASVSGSATGKKQTVTLNGGITVAGSTMSGSQTYNSTTVSASYGTFTLKFDVTANGDDVYVPKTVADNVTTASTTYTGVVVKSDLNASTTDSSVTTSLTSTADVDTNNSAFYIVHDGDTETFTVTVTINPTGTGDFQVGLDKVRFSTTDTDLNSLQTLDLDQTDNEFQTGSVNIRNS